MNKLELFRNSYYNLIGSILYKVELKNTGDIIGYTEDPNLKIGRIPIYKQRYMVDIKRITNNNQDDIISILSDPNNWFENLENAQGYADSLNRTLRKIENNTIKIDFEDLINGTE